MEQTDQVRIWTCCKNGTYAFVAIQPNEDEKVGWVLSPHSELENQLKQMLEDIVSVEGEHAVPSSESGMASIPHAIAALERLMRTISGCLNGFGDPLQIGSGTYLK